MSVERLVEHIDRMQQAAEQARTLTDGMTESAFLADIRTQLAVTMSLVFLGEAAARIGINDPDFIREHPELPWSKIEGMRNLVVHDYYRADLSAIWATVKCDLADLISQLQSIRHWRIQGE
ncbi:HepT-like ribonuclease domain-containing protein [Rhizobium sp. YTU87027]|uniref:HepT-like ribonuclease domain-containing protein n=1 Tax=Rhizobium sp. YTU87027 TaxID=3417741 RepID=UPI003D694082